MLFQGFDDVHDCSFVMILFLFFLYRYVIQRRYVIEMETRVRKTYPITVGEITILKGLIERGKITPEDQLEEVGRAAEASGGEKLSKEEILASLKATRKEIFRKHFR
jgi:hypothetical protein